MRFTLLLFCSTLFAQQDVNILRVIPTPNHATVGEVDFLNTAASHKIGLAAPNTLTGDVLWRLPAMDQTGGGCVNSDGSNNLSISGCGGANSVTVSAAHPMELYCHFTDSDKTHIRFSFSRDYLNYRPVNSSGFGPYTENRDPSCYDDGTTIFIVSSPTPAASSKAQFWTTTDLVTISGPTTIDMTAALTGDNLDFAPEWDWSCPQGSSACNIISALSTSGGAGVKVFTPYLSPITLATIVTCTTTGAATCNSAMGTSHAMTLNGTAQSDVFDFWLVQDPGSSACYAFYVDEYTSTGFPYYQQIAYAKSNKVLCTDTTATFTQVTVPTSPTSADHFAFSKTSEGPAVIPLADSMARYGVAGCYRVYADTWLNLFNSNNNAPRLYTWQYVDTCPASAGTDPFAVIKNAPIPVNIATAEHGTVIRITSQARARVVYSAADYWKNGAIMEDRQRIGTDFSLYSGLTIVKDPPQYFLGNVSPTTIAAGGIDPSAVAQPRSFATWSWCGVAAGSCSPTLGGEGRWTNLFQGVGGGGQVQFGNSNIDTGEVSLALINSPYAWGPNPLSASSSGGSGLWSFGVNNQYLGPIPSGANVGNNDFFIYSKGLGPVPSPATQPTDPSFESGTMSSWAIGGTTAVASTDVAFKGTYSAKLHGAGYIFQVAAGGFVNGTVYNICGKAWGTSGNTYTAQMIVHDGVGANFASGPLITPSAGWSRFCVAYTANSTGNIGLQPAIAGTGASGADYVYFDDFTIVPYYGTIGAFPLTIDSMTGMVGANYGLTVGRGDLTALTATPSINLDSDVPNVLNCGDGPRGHNNCILKGGIFDASYSFRLNGTDVIGGTSGFGGAETRRLDVQRIEPGYSNVPGVSSYTLPASGTATIFSDSGGPGNLTRIQLAMYGSSDSTMLDSRLKVTIDGTLVMNVDLGTFFLMHGSSGGGAGSNKYAELYSNEMRAFTFWGDAGNMAAMRRIFIPWTTSCVITITNASTSNPALFTQVDFYDGPVPASIYGINRRVFHAAVTDITTTVSQYASIDLLPLVTLASGVVGQIDSVDQIVYQSGTGQQPTWLEGDPTWTNDSITYAYGGTEDFFGGQYYFQQNQPRNRDYGVGHIGPALAITLTSFYRYFPDPMTFTSSSKYTWYNGQSGQGPNPPGTVNVGALVVYYTSQ